MPTKYKEDLSPCNGFKADAAKLSAMKAAKDAVRKSKGRDTSDFSLNNAPAEVEFAPPRRGRKGASP